MSSPESKVVRQLRHDVDDVYELVGQTQQSIAGLTAAVTSLAAVQRRHGNRLEEIQTSLDLQNGRFERIEDGQRQILDLLRGRPDEPRS